MSFAKFSTISINDGLAHRLIRSVIYFSIIHFNHPSFILSLSYHTSQVISAEGKPEQTTIAPASLFLIILPAASYNKYAEGDGLFHHWTLNNTIRMEELIERKDLIS
jgi:hypothetical protein